MRLLDGWKYRYSVNPKLTIFLTVVAVIGDCSIIAGIIYLIVR